MTYINKVICGDCLEVMKDIPDKSIDLILCDLPYGTTVLDWDRNIDFVNLWDQYRRIIKNARAIVLFGKEPFSSFLRMSNINWWKYDWVWKKDTKSNFPQAGYQPLNNLELISVFSNGYARNFPANSKHKDNIMLYNPQMIQGFEYIIPKESKTTGIFSKNHKNGKYQYKNRDTSLRFPYNILEYNTDKSKLHPTQKPVALLEYLIKTYTNEGDLILDNCAGSGSTGIAAINTNRNYILIEKEKKYYDSIIDRINKNNNIEDLFG